MIRELRTPRDTRLDIERWENEGGRPIDPELEATWLERTVDAVCRWLLPDKRREKTDSWLVKVNMV